MPLQPKHHLIGHSHAAVVVDSNTLYLIGGSCNYYHFLRYIWPYESSLVNQCISFIAQNSRFSDLHFQILPAELQIRIKERRQQISSKTFCTTGPSLPPKENPSSQKSVFDKMAAPREARLLNATAEEPSESSRTLEGPWECHACTYINTNTTSSNCEMCGTVWWALKEEGDM